MREKGYYSVRTGKHVAGPVFDLNALKKQFVSIDRHFSDRYYFQEAFGYTCVDAGDVPGTLGLDIAGGILMATYKGNLWPIHERIDFYTEDDLFDMIEFSYDHVSKPDKGWHHDFSGCGWHYSTFDRAKGQVEYRAAINRVLPHYGGGYELSEGGEMLAQTEDGFASLIEAAIPAHDPENVENKMTSAILRFRRYRSSLEDRKHAIRELADVLEYLRPKVKQVLLSKDEADLFNLANNFGIRHHNAQQKTDYDPAVWYSWMFYYYLATIHACLRLIEKQST
jgi:hypothetical protein